VIKGKAVQPDARLSECNHPMVKQLSSMLMRFPCKVVSINQAFEDVECEKAYSRVTSLTANSNIGAARLLDWHADYRGSLATWPHRCKVKDKKLTNRHAQTVQTKKAVTAVAAGQLLAVAALSTALLGIDIGFAGVG
jgi:penicillin V acylase-like amidase (Ntn superfamily)